MDQAAQDPQIFTPPISNPHPSHPGGPEHEPARSMVVEAQKQPIEIQPKATVETPPNLELSKEIVPGLHEVHHVDEPIKLPPQVSDAGVAGDSLPPGAAVAIAQPVILPFSQTQIKQHLHDSIKQSARWLAEWCVKQLKEAHLQAKRLGKKRS